MHTTPEKKVVSVKGGCIEGLNWQDAKHIWTKSALVPIPEGVESCEEEPEEAEEEGLFACGEKKWKDTLGGTVRNDDRNGHDKEEESLAG